MLKNMSRSKALQKTPEQFENHFDEVLTLMAKAEPVHKVLKDLKIDESFIAWCMAEPERKELYEKAQAVAAEILMAETKAIADEATPEDIYMAKLRIEVRTKLATHWNNPRYGEKKQLEITNTVDISDAMAAAEARLTQGIVIENDDAE